MAENKYYVALGEEAVRGTKEITTVSFLPLLTIPKLKFEPKDEPQPGMRGAQSLMGNVAMRRMSRAWSGDMDLEMHSEGGTVKGGFGTVIKHFNGKVNSAQNGTTGQYYHMGYPVADPFATANLGTKALTLNENASEPPNLKNYPWIGARPKDLTFSQEPGQSLKLTPNFFGQYRDAPETAIATPVFPAANLRFDFSQCKLYTGAITRTGTAPDYTQFAFGSATQIKPDKLTIKLEGGKADNLRLEGLNYPNKTRFDNQVKASLEFTLDFEDPAAGFSSVDDLNAWFTSITDYINFCAVWDTGVQAGTGDNHMLIIDLPVMFRKGAQPDRDPNKDPMITLSFESLLDITTTQYPWGIMLKNTATTV